jgi:hypothetical protein
MRIRLRGYAGDCTVTGDMDLDGVRLSDALNRLDELVVRDASLESLADGRSLDLPEVALRRDDIFAVEVPDAPPGEGQRRVRMVRHLLQLRMGPYTCVGELHALPGVAPLRTLLVRRTMVPLTNCTLAYERDGRPEIQRMPMLIVNAGHIDHAEEASSEQVVDTLAARVDAASSRETPPPLSA